MAKVEWSQDELREHLEEQLKFLETSAELFDAGNLSEAKRLAGTLRVLVHDTRNSTSLLKMLDLKKIQFVDTAFPFDEQNCLSHSSLVGMLHRKSGIEVVPIFDDGPFHRKISFEPWWNGIVFVDSKRNEFSRKDIVLALANKEGADHIDNLDEAYADLRRNNSLGWIVTHPEGGEEPGPEQVLPTMRQIAHELLSTLRPDYSYHRVEKSDELCLSIGMQAYLTANPPDLHEHNLPKNRPSVHGNKIGRNAPCPCGSGKKYKHCCLT